MSGEKISRYRSEIMGFAILWIMIYHSGISFSFLPALGDTVNNFRANGFGGVDVFLFLSGFGMYWSLSQNPGYLEFYKRRFLRILPAYLPVLTVWLFFRLPGVPSVSWPGIILGNLTGTAFWLESSPAFNWYMLALFSFYLTAPFFFKIMERPSGTGWEIAATLMLCACFYGHYVMIAVTRFPIFVMGMALGRWAARGGQLSMGFELVCYALGAFSYWLLLVFRESLSSSILWNGGFYWYPFILIAPALVFALCRAFSRLESRAPRILWAFRIVGECSLEIYLIHIVAFERIHVASNLTWFLVYTAMVFCGYIYHTVLLKARSWWPRVFHTPGEQRSIFEETEVKKIYIEFLRAAAAFLVIVNHTTEEIFWARAPSPTWLTAVVYLFVSKIAVPVFLFIMGGLLLGKKDSPKKIAERLLRVFVVFTVASAYYYNYYAPLRSTEISLGSFLSSLFRTHVTTAFWYFYLYLGLLCLLPILQRLVQALNRRQLEYLLFLSLGVCGTAPLITIFFPDRQLSNNFLNGLIGPYIGQVLLGYYLERYMPINRKSFWTCLCGFAFLIAFQTAGTYLLYQRDPTAYMSLDNRILIPITGSAACFYVCVKYLFTAHPPCPALGRAICRLGSLTFGIYVLGDVMIRESSPVHAALCGHMHVIPAMVLWELFIFAACALITATLRIIPPLRKWL